MRISTTTTETAKDLWQLKLGLIPDESQSEKDVSAQTQRKKEHTMDKKTIYPINIEPIHISANRGRISINPIMITGDGFNYNVEGEYDLVNPEKAETVISLTQECHQILAHRWGTASNNATTTDAQITPNPSVAWGEAPENIGAFAVPDVLSDLASDLSADPPKGSQVAAAQNCRYFCIQSYNEK